jgi:hypothetical protein
MNKYFAQRPNIGTGDRIACAGNSFFSAMIRMKTEQKFSHEAITMVDTRLDSVDIWEAVGSGFCRTPLSEWLKHYDGEVWHYPLRPQFYNNRRAMKDAAKLLRGTPYDWPEIMRLTIVESVETDEDKLFCSEALYVIGCRAGLPNEGFRKAPVPGDDMDALGWWEPVGVRIK